MPGWLLKFVVKRTKRRAGLLKSFVSVDDMTAASPASPYLGKKLKERQEKMQDFNRKVLQMNRTEPLLKIRSVNKAFCFDIKSRCFRNKTFLVFLKFGLFQKRT